MDRRTFVAGVSSLSLAGCLSSDDADPDPDPEARLFVRNQECLGETSVEEANQVWVDERDGERLVVSGQLTDGGSRQTAELSSVELSGSDLYVSVGTTTDTSCSLDSNCPVLITYTIKIDLGTDIDAVDDVLVYHSGRQVSPS
ncbi:hypothetical protein ACFOZ7_22240 [Natribaculum luteum]|uniref:Lipoprotein n=1 Tax=Natribaculum luteum TaxID=1586232 RepID=A0ABD5P5M6_9EURY|nr:hypothetical protein [Natribaculum luteum]